MPRDINIVAKNLNSMIDQGATGPETEMYLKSEGYDPNKFGQLYKSVKSAPPASIPTTLGGVARGALETVKNIPGDVLNTARDIGQAIPSLALGAVTHPVQLAEGINQEIAKGAAHLLYPKTMGTVSDISQAVMERPIMSGLNIAGGLEGAGVATGIKALSRAAEAVNPINQVQYVGGVMKVGAKGLKSIVSPEVEGAIRRAVKPTGVKAPNFDKFIAKQTDRIFQTAESNGIDAGNINGFVEATQNAQNDLMTSYNGLKGKLAEKSNLFVNGDDVANQVGSMFKGITGEKILAEDPALAAKIQAKVNFYKGRKLTLAEADELKALANSELDGFYQNVKLSPTEKTIIAKEAEALRNGVYENMNKSFGNDTGGREMMKNWGQLQEIKEQALKRKVVADRQNPKSLQEQINRPLAYGKIAYGAVTGQPGKVIEGVGQVIASKYIKEANTTNGLLKNAFTTWSKRFTKTKTFRNTSFALPLSMTATISRANNQNP